MVAYPLLINPAAGRGGYLRGQRGTPRLERLLSSLERNGLRCEVVRTERPGHASELAARAARSGARCVLALGGDGLLREVARGLVGTQTVLLPLPAGTANVLAPCLGLPRNAPEAAAYYRADLLEHARAIDVGICGGEIFLMMASRGLDARALLGVDRRLKRWLGKTGVALSGLREWLRATEPAFAYRIDGIPANATFLAVCNISGYGGMTDFAAGARPDDGMLDVIAFRGSGRAPTLGFALAAVMRRHLDDPRVDRRRVQVVELPGQGPALIQLDGDPFVFELPLRVELDRHRLLVPAPWLLVPPCGPASQASAV
jgi:diacylglycerol kinase (ATP)